ncbi:hypothetical protein BG00_10235 [Pseudoalteromonas sp. SCSIO_11900]|nr:hypothetical protein BG00_10235 [Pseudoalteromonas sp. SCSIO_11900]
MAINSKKFPSNGFGAWLELGESKVSKILPPIHSVKPTTIALLICSLSMKNAKSATIMGKQETITPA